MKEEVEPGERHNETLFLGQIDEVAQRSGSEMSSCQT